MQYQIILVENESLLPIGNEPYYLLSTSESMLNQDTTLQDKMEEVNCENNTVETRNPILNEDDNYQHKIEQENYENSIVKISEPRPSHNTNSQCKIKLENVVNNVVEKKVDVPVLVDNANNAPNPKIRKRIYLSMPRNEDSPRAS